MSIGILALFFFCRRALLAPTLVARSKAHMGATKDFPLSPMREKRKHRRATHEPVIVTTLASLVWLDLGRLQEALPRRFGAPLSSLDS